MKKVALITGASGGIGGEIARIYAEQGYDLALTYYSHEEAVNNLVSELTKKYHGKYTTHHCDLSQEDGIINMVDSIMTIHSRIDTLINNAGISIDTLFADKTTDDFRYTMEVNVIGVFTLSRLVGDIMYEQKGGSIINISSTNGINTYFPMCVDYDASKSALISLTHNLAVQYSPFIRVNAIAPGFIGTANEVDNMDDEYIESEKEKILTHTIGEPRDVAELCYFLSSEKAKFINNTVIRIDGGMYGSI